jgi:hypothetical protein
MIRCSLGKLGMGDMLGRGKTMYEGSGMGRKLFKKLKGQMAGRRKDLLTDEARLVFPGSSQLSYTHAHTSRFHQILSL